MNMMDLVQKQEIDRVLEMRPVPEFSPGDTVEVKLKIVEGTRERIQVFAGLCIARSNNGISSSFTLRKVSYGEGVERVFPLYSPKITEITVVRYGKVRRAKLYYQRDLSGKSARITERTTGRGMAEMRARRKKPATSAPAAS